MQKNIPISLPEQEGKRGYLEDTGYRESFIEGRENVRQAIKELTEYLKAKKEYVGLPYPHLFIKGEEGSGKRTCIKELESGLTNMGLSCRVMEYTQNELEDMYVKKEIRGILREKKEYIPILVIREAKGTQLPDYIGQIAIDQKCMLAVLVRLDRAESFIRNNEKICAYIMKHLSLQAYYMDTLIGILEAKTGSYGYMLEESLKEALKDALKDQKTPYNALLLLSVIMMEHVIKQGPENRLLTLKDIPDGIHGRGYGG